MIWQEVEAKLREFYDHHASEATESFDQFVRRFMRQVGAPFHWTNGDYPFYGHE